MAVVAVVAALAGCTCCGPKDESLWGERLEKADLPTKGFIGLQGKHADATVRFRNVKVRKL